MHVPTEVLVPYFALLAALGGMIATAWRAQAREYTLRLERKDEELRLMKATYEYILIQKHVQHVSNKVVEAWRPEAYERLLKRARRLRERARKIRLASSTHQSGTVHWVKG